MVISKELKKLPPEERIKRLKQLEAEKKKELEEKKREIEELEKKAKEEEEEHLKELQEAEQLMQDSIEDLQEEEERAFEELQAFSRENPEAEISLDDMVEKEEIKKVPDQAIYGKQLEEIKDAGNFYEVTNYNVVQAVDSLAQKAIYEGLTFQEQESLRSLKSNLDRIAGNEEYQKKDQVNYMSRLSQRLGEIDQHLQRQSDYTQKDFDERRKKSEQHDYHH